MHYSTINPGFVLGPLLDQDIGTSGEVIRMFLRGKYPGAPKLSFPVVDVRDIARMHRLALETAEPSGGRYMGVSETAWFIEMMRPIKARLGRSARKVPPFEMPNFLVRLVGVFDAAARGVVPDWAIRQGWTTVAPARRWAWSSSPSRNPPPPSPKAWSISSWCRPGPGGNRGLAHATLVNETSPVAVKAA